MEYPIDSTHIEKVDFDEDKKELTVYFKDKSIYYYFPFYQNQLNDFLKAESKGKYFNQYIKKNKAIRYRKLN